MKNKKNSNNRVRRREKFEYDFPPPTKFSKKARSVCFDHLIRELNRITQSINLQIQYITYAFEKNLKNDRYIGIRRYDWEKEAMVNFNIMGHAHTLIGEDLAELRIVYDQLRRIKDED